MRDPSGRASSWCTCGSRPGRRSCRSWETDAPLWTARADRQQLMLGGAWSRTRGAAPGSSTARDAAASQRRSRGGAHGVVEARCSPARQVGLLQVAGGHLAAEHGVEIAADVRHDVRVEHLRRARSAAQTAVLRHVVVGGAEAAGEVRSRSARCRAAVSGGSRRRRGVVADGGVVQHVHPGGGQQLRQEPGVGVGDAARVSSSRADGDDLNAVRRSWDAPPQFCGRERGSSRGWPWRAGTGPPRPARPRVSHILQRWAVVVGWRGVNTVQQSS